MEVIRRGKKPGEITVYNRTAFTLPLEVYQDQLDCANQILSSCDTSIPLLLESPTGSGKTLMMVLAMETFLLNFDRLSQFIVMTRTIDQLTQLLEKFRTYTSGNVTYGFITSKDKLCIHPDTFGTTGAHKEIVCQAKLRSKNVKLRE